MEQPIFRNYLETLYQCPIVSLPGYCARHHLSGEILSFLSFGGLTGTCQDGLASSLLVLFEEAGALHPGQTVVAASGGDFGAALAAACAVAGHPCTLAIPGNVSFERQHFLESLGAKLEEYPGCNQQQLLECGRELAAKQGAFFIDHFNDDACVKYHRRVTGPALFKPLQGKIDAIVAGVGTGATISGVAEYVRQWDGFLRIIAVEPAEAPALKGRVPSPVPLPHGIPGLGCGFIPGNYNPYVISKVMDVSSAEAQQAAREVLLSDGIPASAASGAALAAARKLVESGKCRRPVVIFGSRKPYAAEEAL